MRVLLDTNVLLRSIFGPPAARATARRAVRTLQGQGDDLLVCLQNLTEFWQNATKTKAANGYDLSIAEADRRVGLIMTDFTFLPDPPGTLTVWRRLTVSHDVRGTLVHDARLAATAIAAGVSQILTFNGRDFARFAPDGLAALDPAAV